MPVSLRLLFLRNALVLIFLFSGYFSSAQTYKQQYDELVIKKDKYGQKELLIRWEKEKPNDAELYVSYFNYYVNLSRTEFIELGQHPKGDDVLVLKSKDSTNKNPVAYMYGNEDFDSTLLNQGFQYIDKGIKRFPNRLDMRFGKIYMLGKIEDYENFTNEIVRTIERSTINENKWTWSEDKPVEEPKKFLLGGVQDYVSQIYDAGDDSLLKYMLKISQSVLSVYPDHVESLSNSGIVYLLNLDYNNALVSFLKAEEIAPTDCIVLNNIAESYKRNKEKENAIKYYQKIIEKCKPDRQEAAKKEIENLKK